MRIARESSLLRKNEKGHIVDRIKTNNTNYVTDGFWFNGEAMHRINKILNAGTKWEHSTDFTYAGVSNYSTYAGASNYPREHKV